MKTDNHITLPDGRRLAYAEFGDARGRPVLYFHGSPSSRLEPALVGDEVWTRLGLRVIAPDRPGMGLSDFEPGRGFSGWARDAAALADALGLGRFAVMGNSGGAPYVAACAARMPERLGPCVVVSGGWRMDWPEARRGMPFPNRLYMAAAKRAPLLLRLMLKAMAGAPGADPSKELAKLKGRVPPADFEAFAAPGRVEALGLMMRESLRQGTRGACWDARLYVREFDFGLEEVRAPLTLFHGEQDANAPVALARRVAAALPGARLKTFEGEAHLSTLCNRFEDYGRALLGD